MRGSLNLWWFHAVENQEGYYARFGKDMDIVHEWTKWNLLDYWK